ncbi:MAG TPA: HAD family phosphatase [Candidatus Limnocylindrales bacterium]
MGPVVRLTPPTSFRAVIFDLDGVIVDSEIWWDDVRRDWAAARGRAWTERDRAAVMGANSIQWARTMRARLGVNDSVAAIETAIVDGVIHRYRVEGPPRIEGAVEAVRRVARQLPVAVATSAHRAVIDVALEATGLDVVFAVVVSSDEVDAGKPAPDVYLLAAERLGIRPADCLVVEDSLNGVRAARAAGMTVVLVPNRSVPPAPGAREAADLVIERLADLDLAAMVRAR